MSLKVRKPSNILGKWRVIVQHVPESRLLLARIATGYEVRLSVTGTAIRLSADQKLAADSKRGRFDDGRSFFLLVCLFPQT